MMKVFPKHLVWDSNSKSLLLSLLFLALIIINADILKFGLIKNHCFILINQSNDSAGPNALPLPCAQKLAQETFEVMSVGIIKGLTDNQAIDFLKLRTQQARDTNAAFILLGELFWNSNQTPHAIEAWQNAVNADLYLAEKSIFEAENNNLEGSLQWANLAQTVDPEVDRTKEEMYSLLCDSLRTAGRAEEALEWCIRSSQVSNNGWRQVALADIYYDLGRFNDSVLLLDEELKNPSSTHIRGLIYHKLGQSYFRLGWFAESESAFHMALRDGYVEKVVYESLVKALIRQNKVEQVCLINEEANEHSFDLDLETNFSISCQ